MSRNKELIRFPFLEPPAPGKIEQVDKNIFWARMPLPFVIDHVNVYILEDVDGLTLVDTGLNVNVCKENWISIFESFFDSKPIKRIIITHHHPDHVGLLGWLIKRNDCEVLVSRTSWLLARMLYLDKQENPSYQAIDFLRKAGMSEKSLNETVQSKPFNFSDVVHEIPLGFRALQPREQIFAGGQHWRVEFGNGHAPDHVTLWGVDKSTLIAGDQVLPGISSNLGVYPTEPSLNTVGLWMETCKLFRAMANSDFLVLPGHNLPFYGLVTRLDQLIENHVGALKRIEAVLKKKSCTAVELFEPIFKRQIKSSEYSLALAESVGHINYLRALGKLKYSERQDGAILYSLK